MPVNLIGQNLKMAGGSTMTDNHGTSDRVQHSDGTGASGNLAKFNADGSLTDAGIAAAGLATGSVAPLKFTIGPLTVYLWTVSILANTGSAPYLTPLPAAFATACLWVSVSPKSADMGALSKIMGADVHPGDVANVYVANANNADVTGYLMAVGY